MSNETIGHWVEKAKAAPSSTDSAKGSTVTVIRRAPPSKGQVIMDMAEKLMPGLTDLLKGVRDNTGMLLQPAHVRGIALNMAQGLIKYRDNSDIKA
jgi:hypothetical protein